MRSPGWCIHCLGHDSAVRNTLIVCRVWDRKCCAPIVPIIEAQICHCLPTTHSTVHLMVPFRAIYMVMNYHTVVVDCHQSPPFVSELCKQTWLAEKHSVHISGSPTLEIRLNKIA